MELNNHKAHHVYNEIIIVPIGGEEHTIKRQ